jgi:hypothetical protein
MIAGPIRADQPKFVPIQASLWGEKLYKKAMRRGLLVAKDILNPTPDPHAGKEELLDLLTKQALGIIPSRRTEVYKRTKKGEMVAFEIRTEYNQLEAQDKLAKLLNLYEGGTAPRAINVVTAVAELPPHLRKTAELDVIEAHTRLLKGGRNGEVQKS